MRLGQEEALIYTINQTAQDVNQLKTLTATLVNKSAKTQMPNIFHVSAWFKWLLSESFSIPCAFACFLSFIIGALAQKYGWFELIWKFVK